MRLVVGCAASAYQGIGVAAAVAVDVDRRVEVWRGTWRRPTAGDVNAIELDAVRLGVDKAIELGAVYVLALTANQIAAGAGRRFPTERALLAEAIAKVRGRVRLVDGELLRAVHKYAKKTRQRSIAGR